MGSRSQAVHTCALQCVAYFVVALSSQGTWTCECHDAALPIHADSTACVAGDLVYRARNVTVETTNRPDDFAIRPGRWFDGTAGLQASLRTSRASTIVVSRPPDARPVFAFYDAEGVLHGSARRYGMPTPPMRALVHVPKIDYESHVARHALFNLTNASLSLRRPVG